MMLMEELVIYLASWLALLLAIQKAKQNAYIYVLGSHQQKTCHAVDFGCYGGCCFCSIQK